MNYTYKRTYVKTFEKADHYLQQEILETNREIRHYLETGKASYGLRIKKLGDGVFEGRVNDKVRMVWVKEKDLISFVMVGSHEEDQNYRRVFCF